MSDDLVAFIEASDRSGAPMSDHPFGFTVQRPKLGSPWDPDDPPHDGEGWQVFLPHKCDAWDIAGDDYEGVPHAEAVARLERFIAEAQVALAALRAEREIEEPADA